MKLNTPEIRFDPVFTEEAVFLYVKANEGNNKPVQQFHHEREEIYQKNLSGDDRDRAFQRLNAKYFSGMGLKEIFEQVIRSLPLLYHPDILFYVKRVWSPKQEESELYLQGDLKTVSIGLQVIRILDRPFLEGFLHHELMHISDMLDPKFRYVPDPVLSGRGEIENNFIRDRFRTLWNLYIDARLKRKGYPVGMPEEKQRRAFERAFAYWDGPGRAEVFTKITGSEGLTQADLLKMAGDQRLAKTLGEGGLRCPLCDFTSYEANRKWTEEEMAVAGRIKIDHPDWDPLLGICPQCFDIYCSKLKISV